MSACLGSCVCSDPARSFCPVHDRPRGEKLERSANDRDPIGLTGEVRPPDETEP